MTKTSSEGGSKGPDSAGGPGIMESAAFKGLNTISSPLIERMLRFALEREHRVDWGYFDGLMECAERDLRMSKSFNYMHTAGPFLKDEAQSNEGSTSG